MDSERLAYLLEQRRHGAESTEERRELQDYLEESGDEEAIQRLFRSLYEEQFTTIDMPAASRAGILDAIFEADVEGKAEVVHMDVDHSRKRSSWKWLAAAAVVTGVLVGGYFVYQGQRRVEKPPVAKVILPVEKDIDPGTNRAVLTLGDGKKIYLDSAASGQLANEKGVKIIKLDSGKLAYHGASDKVQYNTLATPRGGQYQLTLPDGTRVWLNAASSVKYPTVFMGNVREIEISGEVYFEVAQDHRRPFHVRVRDLVVKVLGTNFDIMAYPDEGAIRTTLSEGRVRVRSGDATAVIQTGEQALLNGGEGFNVNRVNLEVVLGWKNGLFKFDKASLQEVLRQFSRWYDIEVVYEGEPKQLMFAGGMGRDLQLSQALYGLANMGVRYRLEGKKLIIMQ